ncbi:MAG: hypothetical protein KGO48_02580, partial [Alphaproteobacteria bacterium]|nr:hypothetical protein [Alphaproteobacteria bacterium]
MADEQTAICDAGALQSREELMKTLAIVAGLSIALAVPVIAAEAVRFPPMPADQYSPQQKQFADLMKQPPRNGNV